jgi:hypothetical protein
MTPKEKAEELFSTYRYALSMPNAPLGEHKDDVAKKCALVAVDEILEATKHEYQIQYESGEWSREIGYKYSEYWQEVKQEIEKL